MKGKKITTVKHKQFRHDLSVMLDKEKTLQRKE